MILIALGANLPSRAGQPADTLKRALGELERQGVEIREVSAFYETPAWPDPADPAFVNAVAAVKTSLQPVELLMLLHGVETDFGRLRSAANALRTLDIDLLDHDGMVMDGPPVLPHPRIGSRAFVLVPLAEVAPGWRHPVTGLGAAELLAAFEEAYRGLYSRVIPGVEVEVLSWVLLLSGPAPAGEGNAPAEPPPSYPEPARRRPVFEPDGAGFVEVAIYERPALSPGAVIAGPAVIVEDETSTVVSRSFDARIDARGYIELTRRIP